MPLHLLLISQLIVMPFIAPTGLTYRLTAIDALSVRYEMRGYGWPIGMEETGSVSLDAWARWINDTNGAPANVGIDVDGGQRK